MHYRIILCKLGHQNKAGDFFFFSQSCFPGEGFYASDLHDEDVYSFQHLIWLNRNLKFVAYIDEYWIKDIWTYSWTNHIGQT